MENYKFDVNRSDLYEYGKPKDRTKKRLVEIADCGMEETMIATFGYNDVVGGLYLEYVWGYSDDQFKDYMDWAKSLIEESLKNN